MQVAETAADARHVVGAVLVSDPDICVVAKTVSKRCDYRYVGTLRSAGHRVSQHARLVQDIRTFLKAVLRVERDVRAEPVLEGRQRIMIRLVPRARALVKGIL